MEFVAIDFETANADLASICQVGIASFHDSEVVESWSSLVDPQDDFDPINISIHGITEETVAGAPTWVEVFPKIASRIAGNATVCHTAFDRVAFGRACERYAIEPVDCRWLNSACVTRRAWKEFARSGYGLSNVARCLGIEYRAHDALEDARCAGLVLLRAMEVSGRQLDSLFDWVKRPINDPRIQRDANPDGEMVGEVLVFTGALTMPRSDAADLAASVGCTVDSGVTKHTTILVVGNQDIRHLAGKEKSSKHLRAESLIAKGQPIRILTEQDFERVVHLHREESSSDKVIA